MQRNSEMDHMYNRILSVNTSIPSDLTDIPLGGLVNGRRQVNLRSSGRLGKARCKSATVTQL